MTRTFRYALIIAVFLTGARAAAQEMKLPMWMLQAMAGDRSSPKDRAMDEKIYAGLGLNSLRANRFIGSYTGTINKLGDDLHFDFSGWTDTTKGTMAIRISKGDVAITVTYLADLRANMAVMASDKNGMKTATISPLRDLLLLNALMRDQSKQDRLKATKRTRKINGIACKEQYFMEGEDTTRVWSSTIAHSPFVDAWNWMPLAGEGPLMIFGFLGSLGDPMPMRMSGEDMTIEITSVKQGRQPQPAFDLSTYSVKDKREGDRSNVPVTHSSARPSASKPSDKAVTGAPARSTGAKQEKSNIPPQEELVIGNVTQEGEEVIVAPQEAATMGNIAEEPTYDMVGVQEQPQFPGGQEAMYTYIAKNLRYPAMEKEAGIQGKVFIEFVVEKDGSVVDVTVKRGVPGGNGLGQEAARIVRSMPKWIPGKLSGRPVRVRMIIPLQFKLQ